MAAIDFVASLKKSGNNLRSLLRGMEQAKSTITFINYENKTQAQQILVPGLSGSDITSAILGNGAEGGFIKESVKKFFHEFVILGDPPAFERLFTTSLGTTGPADDTFCLEAAWDSVDEFFWKAYINTNGKTQKAFEEACKQWPLVFAAYRVKEDYNFMAGTKWESMFQFKAKRFPRIRSHLLTGINPTESNPMNWIPRQIPIEYKGDDAAWHTAELRDNLNIAFDGTHFIVDNLRDTANTSAEHQTWTGTFTDPLNITARNIRITMAVEADFRIRGYAGQFSDPNKTKNRVYQDQNNGTTWTYVHVAKALDYIEWLRKNSYPVGQAVPTSYRGTPTAPGTSGSGWDFTDKAVNGKELFSDQTRIQAHADARLAKLKKIEYSGQTIFKMFDPAYLPGARVNGILGSGIPISTAVKAVTLKQNSQDMEVNYG